MMLTLTAPMLAVWNGGWKIQRLTCWIGWRRPLKYRFPNYSNNHVVARHRLNHFGADERRCGSETLARPTP